MALLVGLFSGLVSLLAGILVGAVAVYAGVPLGVRRTSMTGERALVTAAVAAIVSVVVGALFGWIPIVGTLLSVAAWVGVVGYFTSAAPQTAVGVGLVSWAITLVVTTGVVELLVGTG